MVRGGLFSGVDLYLQCFLSHHSISLFDSENIRFTQYACLLLFSSLLESVTNNKSKHQKELQKNYQQHKMNQELSMLLRDYYFYPRNI